MFSLIKALTKRTPTGPANEATGAATGGVTTTHERPAVDIHAVWDTLSPFLFTGGMVLLVLAFLAASGALFQAVQGLGVLFKIPADLCLWTAVAVSVAFVGHSLVAAFSPSNALKFWNGVSSVVWLVIVMTLTATYSILRLVGIGPETDFQTMQLLLGMGGAVVSGELLTIGRYAYAVLIALALSTLTISVFGAIGMMRRNNDPRHATLGHVAADSGVTIVIVAAAAYSGLHMFTYGSLIGNDMFTAAMSSILAELTFIVASKRAIQTRRGAYVVLGMVAIGYAGLVNWLEGRAIGQAAGLMDAGARAVAVEAFLRSDGIARLASDLYSTAGIWFAAAMVILEVVTHRAGLVATGASTRSTALQGDVVRPRLLSRLARRVSETRSGAREIADAWRGQQLAAPGAASPEVVLAKDAPDAGRARLVAPEPEPEPVGTPGVDAQPAGVTGDPKGKARRGSKSTPPAQV